MLPIILLLGGYHTVYQVIESKMKRRRDSLWSRIPYSWDENLKKNVRRIITFVVVSYLWMIFRTSDFGVAMEITKGYFRGGTPYIHQTTMFFFAIGFLLLFIKDFKDEFYPDRHYFLESRHLWARCLSFASLVILIILVGVIGGGQFIYFQF